MKLLENGNATMGVWLGKNILGQTDEVRHQISASAILGIVLPRAPELEQLDDENTIDIKALGR